MLQTNFTKAKLLVIIDLDQMAENNVVAVVSSNANQTLDTQVLQAIKDDQSAENVTLETEATIDDSASFLGFKFCVSIDTGDSEYIAYYLLKTVEVY